MTATTSWQRNSPMRLSPARAPEWVALLASCGRGRTGSWDAPKMCENSHFSDPCGVKVRGSGGAPPTHLILLRNQRPEAERRHDHRGAPPDALRHPFSPFCPSFSTFFFLCGELCALEAVRRCVGGSAAPPASGGPRPALAGRAQESGSATLSVHLSPVGPLGGSHRLTTSGRRSDTPGCPPYALATVDPSRILSPCAGLPSLALGVDDFRTHVPPTACRGPRVPSLEFSLCHPGL